ncbi:acyl-CoA dehydrogenase family protein [Pseudonocardia endophytica]|uniref:Alkylation response protein AidB-like acyl-CoA dehydrogenase n=1 Tax=Pseudonocardia endophytica TaxID=401976 RepID=A0A4R1HID5_PSEEN|nr:acyl-CoA dehydrogenase family protein [Pseudonocardia endophytica]TCK22044.1 alkylation response protein AidB-like acyl-CoA dehydrogenase [Pseudonocardia endophytica]
MTLSRQTDLAQFRADAEQWLRASVPERWKAERGALSEQDTTEVKREWDRQLFAGGFAGLSLPAEHGGQGLGLAEEVAFHELAARAHAPEGFGRIGKILTAPTLIVHGTEEQRGRFLPGILSGEQVWCQGFSEPGAGSDLAGVSTVARRDGNGYRVTGQKVWTSFADVADRSLLLARSSPDAPRYRNLSMLLLDMRQPGVVVRPIKQISGATHFAEVFFEDVWVADEDRLGDDGQGWKVAMTVLQNERGIVEGITRYVEMRGDMDLLIAHCAGTEYERAAADLDVRLELVRWQVAKSVELEDDPVAFVRASSVLKVTWSELWQEMTQLGLRVAPAEHLAHWRHQYLETRASSIYSGSSEIQRNIIAERVLGLPK